MIDLHHIIEIKSVILHEKRFLHDRFIACRRKVRIHARSYATYSHSSCRRHSSELSDALTHGGGATGGVLRGGGTRTILQATVYILNVILLQVVVVVRVMLPVEGVLVAVVAALAGLEQLAGLGATHNFDDGAQLVVEGLEALERD